MTFPERSRDRAHRSPGQKGAKIAAGTDHVTGGGGWLGENETIEDGESTSEIPVATTDGFVHPNLEEAVLNRHIACVSPFPSADRQQVTTVSSPLNESAPISVRCTNGQFG